MDPIEFDENVLQRPRNKASFISWLVFDLLQPLCMAIACVAMVITCWDKKLPNLYIAHVLFAGLGFHLVMAVGISMPHGGNRLVRNSTRTTRKTIHWILQAVGGACALIGTLLQYIGREKKQKPHFHSTHSIVGLIAVIVIVVSMLNGVLALFGRQIRGYVRPWLARLMHQIAGAASFSLGMWAILLAYEKHLFTEILTYELRIGLMVVTVATGVISLCGIFKQLYHFIYEQVVGCNSRDYILNDDDE